GFLAKYHVESVVLGFSLRKAAEHDYRDPIVFLSQLAHELRTVTAGHDVIGNDQGYAVTENAQRRQGAFSGGRNANRKAGIAQHRLPNAQLQSVIVDQKHLAHVSLTYGLVGLRISRKPKCFDCRTVTLKLITTVQQPARFPQDQIEFVTGLG